MTVTKQFLILVLIGTVFIGISIPTSLYLQAFILYNMLIFILIMIDYYRTPTKNVFEIERVGDKKLSLLEEEKIILKIYNRTNLLASIEVLQELPSSFECKEMIVEGSINPYSNKEFVLRVIPRKRGAFLLEDIYIRRRGILHLIKKDIRIHHTEEYKVYPSLKNLKKYHLMLRKDNLVKSGENLLKKRSDGRDFESLREYVKGDDVRKINWIKSARENKLIVNQYEPESDKHIYILLDTGRTMSYRVNQYSKLDLAINAALFLSDAACYNKDKSGLLVFNTKIDAFIKPAKGDFHRNLMLETLYHIEGTRMTSSYEEALFYLSKQEKKRSLICMFTDIDTLQEVDYIRKALEYIVKKHYVVIFLVKNEKLEEVKLTRVNSRKDAFVKGIAYKMEEERKSIIRALQQRGVNCIECDREDIIYKAINEYMKIKNREAI
ncbi:Uncharacterized conserved protein, DUF58 family, contains vWF domain [Anaerovirgula multivorans]|uniref:Uncharacterized conserved protein, DUF58 family, contains vWF domain n=1 Tax=Anaerovirgula multivorans TaxID=312168 RepID=A0A239FUU5_9FIRM|nr:DUF58 domain-containing protein [Anaerovirgula multivorans]SNS59902.1 Uncharacterized conserved protein, DUF58 family, contains vWF domain [Anaerovirgula multivorans]